MNIYPDAWHLNNSIQRSLLTFLILFCPIPISCFAGDKYILPQGAGTKDGSSFENALSAGGEGLQKACETLAPGETCHIGSGQYLNVSLDLTKGGAPNQLVNILGVDTGSGLPCFRGDWKLSAPSAGLKFITLQNKISHLSIKNLTVLNYKQGIVFRGKNVNIQIERCNFKEAQEGIIIDGDVDLKNLTDATHDVVIKDCEISNYTKRGIRIKGGVYDTKIIACTADGGGAPYGTEKFPCGFQVAADKGTSEIMKKARDQVLKGSPAEVIPTAHEIPYDHDITFIDCVSKNHYFDNGSAYWQGDGFVSEHNSYNIRYIRCKAFDNTDGGWDEKSKDVYLEDCIALRNKKNFRIWSELPDKGATMIRCVGAYSRFPGGTSEAVGFWTRGKVNIENCTFHNNDIQLDLDYSAAVVTISKSIISTDSKVKGKLSDVTSGATLQTSDCIEWIEGVSGEDPKFVAPKADWDGEGKNFDSAYQPKKGFFKFSESVKAASK